MTIDKWVDVTIELTPEHSIRYADFGFDRAEVCLDPAIVPACGMVTVEVAEIQRLIVRAYEDGRRVGREEWYEYAKACVKAEDNAPEDEPYDDSKDHDPCPECAHTQHPGRDVVNPVKVCPRCYGSQWI